MFYELSLTFNATRHEELIKGDFVQERFCQECKCIFIAKRNYSEYMKYELIQFYQALLCDAVQLSCQNLEPAIWKSLIWVLLWPIVRLVSHELWAQLLSCWMLVNNQFVASCHWGFLILVIFYIFALIFSNNVNDLPVN